MKIELNTSDIKPVAKNRQPGPDADQIGATLFSMRQAAQMTQAEVAKVLGLERTSVTNIESGKQRAELRHLTKLADHLGLDVHIAFKPKVTHENAAPVAAPTPPAQPVDLLERCAQWCDEQPKSNWWGRTASDMVRAFAATTTTAEPAVPESAEGAQGEQE